MVNKKFNGKIVITSQSTKSQSNQETRIARFDKEKTGINPKQVFTPEELDELYAHDPDEPWWNR